MIRPFVKVPLIAIDDAMGRKAVTYGDKILVLATAGSTEGPMREKLNAEAAKLNKTIQIDFTANAEAFQAMKAVQMDRHDAILLDMAKDISGYDCVVLASGIHGTSGSENRRKSVRSLFCQVPDFAWSR